MLWVVQVAALWLLLSHPTNCARLLVPGTGADHPVTGTADSDVDAPRTTLVRSPANALIV